MNSSSWTSGNKNWSIDTIPAFCITLERRQDRWRRFQDQPGIQGLDLKRFLGVDGKTLDWKKDDRIATLTKRNIATKTRRSHEELDSIGGVGCALSHIAVWQWMVDQNQPLCLVFEDDAIVPADFKEKANRCIQQSVVLKDPQAWDMWLLGGKWDELTSIPGEPKESGVVRVGAFVLFHAYVLTLHTAKRLLKEAYPIHAHIDIWASIFAYYNDLRLVGCQNLMLKQNIKVTTDIQSEEGCAICNIPIDYDKTSMVVSKMEWRLAQMSEVICVGLLVYFIYKRAF
jgi:glycosyl transferase family 25